MTDTPLPFPRKGLNDNWAFGQQPGESTRDAQNVRSVDPTNGRTRGAQRSGMSKHKDEIVGSARPVRLVRSATYEAKTVTYEALQGDLDTGSFELAEEEWAKTPDNEEPVVNTAVDLSGNLYALAGKTVEKRNPDGVLLWSFPIPVDKSAFTLGPMVVGTDLAIFVGVDGGTPLAEGAGVFKIDQVPVANTADTIPELAWTWVFDRWVRELRLHQGTLKVLLQDDTAYRSHVLTLANIALAIPAEQGQIEVPYPSTCFVVKEDGSIVSGHPPFVGRDSSPLNPGVGISLEEWTMGDLVDYDKRVWSSYRASDLLSIGLQDGDPVTLWPDRTVHGRNLAVGSFPSTPGAGPGAPTLRVSGSTGLPSIYFDGSQGLFSAAGGGRESQKEACKTMVPNHGDGAYCMMIVCRPSSQKTPEEKDESGADIDATRWLFNQFTHTKYGGDITANADLGYTEAHRSGLLINSVSDTGTGQYHYSWSGEFNGKGSKLGKYNSPGYVQAFTPSSGSQSLVSTTDGLGANPDFTLMPTNRGAGWAGWPLEGLYDDPAATTPGEGLCVITFMNCGGLDEALAVTGTYDVGVDFTAPAGSFARYPVGATGVIHAGGASDTVTVASSTELTLGTGNIPSGSDVASHVVWSRNWMSRSLLRINGEPIDRWEALPMSFNGPGNAAGSTRSTDLNVEHNPTGLGYPLTKKTNVLGFLGEIMEIHVLGRREQNSERVSLSGTNYALYPAVIDHPMYAANHHSSETGAAEGDDAASADKGWVNVGTNVLSSELEKMEGELMHRHGISNRLPATADTYAHPHYPATGIGITTYDIPLVSNVTSTGQAWVPRKRSEEAMIAKHDQAGKMLWCLLADVGTGFGDIFSEDVNGNEGVLGVTDAEPTAGLALTSDGDIYVAGPGERLQPFANSEQFAFGIIFDAPLTADNPRLTSQGFWRLAGDEPDPEFRLGFAEDQTIRLVVDAFNNLYSPVPPGTQYEGADAHDAVRVFGRDVVTDPMVSLIRLTTLGGVSKYQNARSVSLPPTNPDYSV